MAKTTSKFTPMSWCMCRQCTEKNAKGLYIETTKRRSHALRYPPLLTKPKKARKGGRKEDGAGTAVTARAAPAAVVAVAVSAGIVPAAAEAEAVVEEAEEYGDMQDTKTCQTTSPWTSTTAVSSGKGSTSRKRMGSPICR